jgi:hypothetical protein
MADQNRIAKMEKPEEDSVVMAPERKGPFLSAALIAERVLAEEDGTLTFVRIVDKCVIPAEAIKNRKGDDLDFSPMRIALTFKAWGYGEKSHVLIIQGGPSGKSKPLGMTEIPFDGTQGRSYPVFAPVVITWDGDGFYWFDIQLDNKFVTRIPFEIRCTPETPGEIKQ